MFVYELIGLFLRSLNIAFFILEECCAVLFPKTTSNHRSQPYAPCGKNKFT